MAEPTQANRLKVVETDDAFIVVYAEDSRADDPDDWIAKFAKQGQIDAQAWAERMIKAFTERTADEKAA